MKEATTVQEDQLVKINAADYGIESSKAKEIEEMFSPMLNKMKELESEYNTIINQPISQELCAQAKNLRLKYVKVRTGTAEIHKSLKDFYLKGGRFVDGWKNAQLFASQQIEESLTKIEKHYENLENERLEKLRAEREAMLRQYTEVIPLALGHMPQDVWDNYFKGVKIAYEAQKEAERKAEEERQERERKLRPHAQRKDSILNLWNFLTPEQTQFHFGEMSENDWLVLVETLNQKKTVYDKEQDKIRKEKERLQREARAREKQIEEERKTARIEQDKKDYELRLEREKAAKLQAELKAKEESDRKAKAEAEQKAEAERKAKEAEEKKNRMASDKVKLVRLANELDAWLMPELKNPEAENILNNIKVLISKTTAYIREKAEQL